MNHLFRIHDFRIHIKQKKNEKYDPPFIAAAYQREHDIQHL